MEEKKRQAVGGRGEERVKAGWFVYERIFSAFLQPTKRLIGILVVPNGALVQKAGAIRSGVLSTEFSRMFSQVAFLNTSPEKGT